MEIQFTKMHGLGNDLILIDDRNGTLQNHTAYSAIAAKLCHRHFGIGGDGLIVITNSKLCDIGFKIYNADGSEPEMCGNGMRCFAKYVYEKGIVQTPEFQVETLAGAIVPKINFDKHQVITSVTVDMGPPIQEPAKIPFLSYEPEHAAEKLETSRGSFWVTAVSMGNPHAVIFVEDISKTPIHAIGPEIECHPRFPQKTNVEFVEVLSNDELKMRVWERGVGVTLACGTGACAAVVAAILNGKTKNNVTIHLDGGPLQIEWNVSNNRVYKTGPAKTVFHGILIWD